jgi:HAD superfamily hydrolase (TIGR01509 family)
VNPAGQGEVRAVVFDFDGLIVDTEMPEFRSWSEEFERHGASLDLEWWLGIVGTYDAGFDPIDRLREVVGDVDVDTVIARRRSRHLELVAAERPLPGVRERIREAREMDLPLGIASSSRHGWVAGHLERIGLEGDFSAIVGRDDVGGRSKPAPDVYIAVCDQLGVAATESVAIEDSSHGVAAATAAGLRVVAVPNRITQHTDLTEATVLLDSLAAHDLGEILELVAAG